jgi:hypothetical protein
MLGFSILILANIFSLTLAFLDYCLWTLSSSLDFSCLSSLSILISGKNLTLAFGF